MRSMLDDPLVRAVLWLAGYSVLVWAVALALGMAERPESLPATVPFETYFQAVNWWPFPAFFLCLVPVVHLTWGSFLNAWRDLARTGVLLTGDGRPASEAAVRAVTASIGRRRRWALLIALVAAIAVNGLDLVEPWSVFFGSAPLADQVAFACRSPDAWTKWILLSGPVDPAVHCVPGGMAALPASPMRLEPPGGTVAFSLMTLAQQVAIVFVVGAGMAQLILHACLFAGFERLVPAARAHGLTLRLNAASPVSEFGLERWNYALNNFYWAACPALLGVYLSRLATPPEDYAPGQAMLGWIVPALLLAPMVLTILTRQVRLPEVWARLDDGRKGGPTRESYARQQLWPLDRNWSSKLGIILAFILAALALGHEMSRLLVLT